MKNKKGITLVALIITIIVIVILAGVIITAAVADGGVIERAQTAGDKQAYATAEEKIKAQAEYITEGENAGKVDLSKTEENISELNLKEIKEVNSTQTLLTITLNDESKVEIEGVNGKNSNSTNKLVYGKAYKATIETEEDGVKLVEELLIWFFEQNNEMVSATRVNGQWLTSPIVEEYDFYTYDEENGIINGGLFLSEDGKKITGEENGETFTFELTEEMFKNNYMYSQTKNENLGVYLGIYINEETNKYVQFYTTEDDSTLWVEHDGSGYNTTTMPSYITVINEKEVEQDGERYKLIEKLN